jgi:hypothetical protein
MGWTGGELDGPFTSCAAIAFELGEEFAERVIATARYGTVIYAAVRAADSPAVFGLVLLAERRGGILYTKPISEEMGPSEDFCPARILDLLTEPHNDHARDWRERCRDRIARGRPRKGQAVLFASAISFTDGTEHQSLVFLGGSQFRSSDGGRYHVGSWWKLEYQLGIS